MKLIAPALVAALAGAAAACTEFGGRAAGARLARIERSPEWRDGKFANPEPMVNDVLGSLTGAFAASEFTAPKAPPPTVSPPPASFLTTPATGLRVTWFGHSSALVEVDGHRVLTDPVWSERASPFGWVGPKRWFPPLIALDQLPPLDAVLISHDHYDHLDRATVQGLNAVMPAAAVFIVPLGVGAHLAAWGVPDARIVELDWWEAARAGDLTITLTPARHASGRTMVFDYQATLWGGFALTGPRHRVYYSGDTGLFPALAAIGERLGPFDLTLIECGQYHQAWPDWHLGPEQAVAAHGMVKGKVMLPVHWGEFALAYHGWTEPIERVLVAARNAGAAVVTPRLGASIEPALVPQSERWWPDVPWQTAAQHSVKSGGF